ncbi:hypothetical protein C1646_770082 [Rhizophagus diaphanus]|nr:hypothetical protein C1646_770082 [Rhizophagus diaphanus] [Rhizophagus sp. MUCL 43196]
MYGKKKGLEIIQDTDSETTKVNTRIFSGKKCSRTIFEDENYFNNQSSEDEYDSNNESVMTFNSNTTSNTNTTFTSSTTLSNKTGITGPLDNFAVRKLFTNQEQKWWTWEKILKDASEDIIKSIETKAKADLVSVMLTIDSWTNVINQNLLDSILITSKGEVLVWKAYDINTERSRIAEVKEKIESLTKNVQDAGIKVAAIVTDSALQYASTWRVLQIDNLDIIYLSCFYQKYINLIPPGDTRWNSYFYCFGSILNTKEALKTLVVKYEPSDDPSVFSSRKDELKLPTNIYRAYLFEVFYSFGYFYKFFNNYNDDTLSNRMCIRLENRWKTWEQPLLVLSFILHPDYQFNKFNTELPNMNWVDIGQWTKELGFIAKKIFGIAVNAAIGFFYFTRRNRLHHKKVLSMTQIHGPEILNNIDKDIENENRQDDGEDSDLNIIEDNKHVIRGENWDTIVTMWNKMLDEEANAEHEMEHEDMLENYNNFGDNIVSAYLSNRTHPQRDNNAK